MQGLPDNWTLIGEPVKKYDEDGSVKEIERYYIGTDGKRKKVSDSARYKALGNSIALPFWFYLLRRISAQYEPVLWESEVEEFCIAVSKQHFGDEETGLKGDINEYL